MITAMRSGEESKAASVSRDDGAGLRPLFRLDAGWLFLLAGLATIGATVLIPATQDLADTEWERDRARAIEGHRNQRLGHYAEFMDGLRRGDEAVLLSLSAAQQNKTTIDRFPLYTPPNPRTTSASVFPALEPDPLVIPPVSSQQSLLGRLATGDGTRLWVLAAGMISILLGLVIGCDESCLDENEADEAKLDGPGSNLVVS